MAGRGSIITVDIGKTTSKVTLWSRAGTLLDRQTRANSACESEGLRRLDAEGIGAWLIEALGGYSAHPVEAIVPVAHGAGVAALKDGVLAFPPLDYEQALPPEIMAEYRAERDDFALTGSPALPDGLNLGSQLFWLDRLCPKAMEIATLLPWAQYWAWFLGGEAVSEVTSLGCHSDLWNPSNGDYSPLAKRWGWNRRFAPLVKASKPIGTLRPELAEKTGLSPKVLILAGLHDSNAALLAARGFPEIADHEATVLSTGTWFIAMRLARGDVDLAAMPEMRDCLMNVDAFGQPVPSSRFMGGREIEKLIETGSSRIDIDSDQPALLNEIAPVLSGNAAVLPTLAPGCGPFPEHRHSWLNRPEDILQRRTAAGLYAALVADTALDLIGSKDRLLIEGRFAQAQVFVRALAGLRPGTRIYTANAENDVSFGALRLIDPGLTPQGELLLVEPLEIDLSEYKTSWHRHLENRT